MIHTIKYPSSGPITMSSDKPSSDPSAQPSTDPDILKRGSQEAQVSLHKYIIILILHIIFSSSSSQRYTWKRWQGSLRISYIEVHKVYYETRALFPTTKSLIYNKEKRKQVKVFILHKSTMDSNTFLFDPTVLKIGHSWFGQARVFSTYLDVVVQ